MEEFFGHLTTESPNVRTYIQEALCTMLDAFNPIQEWATTEDVTRILLIIENNINKVHPLAILEMAAKDELA